MSAKSTLPMYRVILCNDDFNSFEHVIKTLQNVFPELNYDGAVQTAQAVHSYQAVNLITCHYELAETYKVWLEQANLKVKLERDDNVTSN